MSYARFTTAKVELSGIGAERRAVKLPSCGKTSITHKIEWIIAFFKTVTTLPWCGFIKGR